MEKKNKVKLDKFYNLIANNDVPYGDNLGKIVDEIAAAKERGEISSEDTGLLLKLAILVETNKEITSLSAWITALNETQETSSAMINFSHKERNYA